MTYEDFKTLIDTYGANPKRWPSDMRDTAQAFADANHDLVQTCLSEGRKLDEALDMSQPANPSDLLKARILKAAQSTPQDQPASVSQAPQTQWKRMAAMMLFAFGAGFGGAQFVSLPTSPSDPVVMTASLDEEDLSGIADNLGLSDIYSWVQDPG